MSVNFCSISVVMYLTVVFMQFLGNDLEFISGGLEVISVVY